MQPQRNLELALVCPLRKANYDCNIDLVPALAAALNQRHELQPLLLDNDDVPQSGFEYSAGKFECAE
jgi:hypothetical protein